MSLALLAPVRDAAGGRERRGRLTHAATGAGDASTPRCRCPTCCARASRTSWGIRRGRLRVVAPDVGGGFGQKMSLFPRIRRARVAGGSGWRPQARPVIRGPTRENFLRAALALARHGLHRGAAAFRLARPGSLDSMRILRQTSAPSPAIRVQLRGPNRSWPSPSLSRPLRGAGKYGGALAGRDEQQPAMMAPYRGVARPMLTLLHGTA